MLPNRAAPYPCYYGCRKRWVNVEKSSHRSWHLQRKREGAFLRPGKSLGASSTFMVLLPCSPQPFMKQACTRLSKKGFMLLHRLKAKDNTRVLVTCFSLGILLPCVLPAATACVLIIQHQQRSCKKSLTSFAKQSSILWATICLCAGGESLPNGQCAVLSSCSS